MAIAAQSPFPLKDLLERIEAAQIALRKAPYGGLKAADCHLADGHLVLSGSVPSFFLKQMAQTLMLQVLDSTIQVDNRLEVDCTISTD